MELSPGHLNKTRHSENNCTIKQMQNVHLQSFVWRHWTFASPSGRVSQGPYVVSLRQVRPQLTSLRIICHCAAE